MTEIRDMQDKEKQELQLLRDAWEADIAYSLVADDENVSQEVKEVCKTLARKTIRAVQSFYATGKFEPANLSQIQWAVNQNMKPLK